MFLVSFFIKKPKTLSRTSNLCLRENVLNLRDFFFKIDKFLFFEVSFKITFHYIKKWLKNRYYIFLPVFKWKFKITGNKVMKGNCFNCNAFNESVRITIFKETDQWLVSTNYYFKIHHADLTVRVLSRRTVTFEPN